MSTFYNIYLEPLEERYTEQWLRWFRAADYNGFKYDEINGKALTTTIQKGAFLDVNSTIHWKAEQVKELSRLFFAGDIEDGDVFFVADMWFPCELLKYLIDLNKVKAKVFAFLHAGSYTTEDFAAPLAPWAKYHEVGWAASLDGIFVGSNYAKNNFFDRRIRPGMGSMNWETKRTYDKIQVVGNPFNSAEALASVDPMPPKDNQIIFPNRFDYEKRPNLFLDLAVILKERHPAWQFVITTSRQNFRSNQAWLVELAKTLEGKGIVSIHRGIPKSEYYRLLAQSKVMVSTTIEENFGYCTLESLVFRTVPIVPDAFSHPEIVMHPGWLYKDLDDAIEKIEAAMFTPAPPKEFFQQRYAPFDMSVQRMVNVMTGAK